MVSVLIWKKQNRKKKEQNTPMVSDGKAGCGKRGKIS